ncbi:MAG: DUF4830 domain-containing protein [Ruminococcus sp.]
MFVFNFKIADSKKVFAIFAVASVTVAIICIICMISVHNSFPDTATCDELGSYSLKCDKGDEQCAFLEQFGLSPLKIADSCEVTIPTEFNETYEEYNELQKSIGLDLEKFKGKSAQKVTYELENSKIKYAVLLIYRGKVIGGHLTNGEYGSENLPLI